MIPVGPPDTLIGVGNINCIAGRIGEKRHSSTEICRGRLDLFILTDHTIPPNSSPLSQFPPESRAGQVNKHGDLLHLIWSTVIVPVHTLAPVALVRATRDHVAQKQG